MNKKTNILLISAINNIIIAILKLFGGILGKSKTLLADAIHSLSDLASDAFLVLGSILSNKKADYEHPFGHGKYENIFSMIMGIIIIFVGIFILKETSNETYEKPKIWICIISLVVIILKYIVSKILLKKGKEYSSALIIASGKENRMDVLSSSFVLFVIILSQFQERLLILKYIDTLGGIIISLFIVYTGINMIEEQTNELIGKREENEHIENIINKIIKEQNLEIYNIDLIKFGNKYFPIIDILIDKNKTIKETNKIRLLLEEKLKEQKDLVNTKIIMIPKE